jgi:hypothetical protein
MKKVTIYSLLFACLLALSPLHIKADPKSTLAILMSDRLSQFWFGSTLCLGLSSLYFFKSYKDIQKSHFYRDMQTYAEVVASTDPIYTQTTKKIAHDKITKHLNDVKNPTIKGFACLAAAGLGCYLTYKAIQQARS